MTLAAGLPVGQMSNFEVGHMNLGAGRVVYQSFTRINKAISDGEFQTNAALVSVLSQTRAMGGTINVLRLRQFEAVLCKSGSSSIFTHHQLGRAARRKSLQHRTR